MDDGATGLSEGLGSVDELENVARELSAASHERERIKVAVEAAVELVGGCDHAGVTILDRGGFTTPAATDDVAARGDQLQYKFDEGPCLDSVRHEETVLSQDLAADQRWPRWAPAVQSELGTSSMLSLLLYTSERSMGALNLYGDRRRAFDSDDIVTARALAGHLAVAMAAGRQIEQLTVAVGSRTIIGQAEGILMERLGIDAQQAFNYLRRVSMDTNRKLIQVADDLVRTRQLLGPGDITQGS